MRFPALVTAIAALGCGGSSSGVGASFHPVDAAGRSDTRITLSGSFRLPHANREKESLPPAVVVVHGLRGDRGQLGHVVDALTGRGIAVLHFDIRGHGASTGPFPFEQPDRYGVAADDAAGALAWLRHRHDIDTGRIALMGASLGGGAVLATALRERLPVVAWYPGLTYGFDGDSLVNAGSPDLRGLIIHGTADTTARAAPALAVRFAGRNPRISLIMIEGGGHGAGPHRAEYLATTVDSLIAWLGIRPQ